MPSTLLATTCTVFCCLRKYSAMPRSAAVNPARASTKKITTSASSTANRDWFAISASIPASSPVIPPVSMTINWRSSNLAVPYLRSRVRPGKSATSASREFVKRLNNVDLPTFGRPTRAKTGSMVLP